MSSHYKQSAQVSFPSCSEHSRSQPYISRPTVSDRDTAELCHALCNHILSIFLTMGKTYNELTCSCCHQEDTEGNTNVNNKSTKSLNTHCILCLLWEKHTCVTRTVFNVNYSDTYGSLFWMWLNCNMGCTFSSSSGTCEYNKDESQTKLFKSAEATSAWL